MIANWSVTDSITIKSLTSHRLLEEDTNNNWAGALNQNGLMLIEDIEQEQLSQELQFTGSSEQLQWVAGVFYFKENVNQNTQALFSLANDLTQITPPAPLKSMALSWTSSCCRPRD